MPAPLQIATPSEREVVITRRFAAPPELVFDCHTRADLVRRWLLGPPGWTMPVCEIDLRVGGRYRYVWRSPDGQDMGMGGTFRDIARPERVVSTELFDDDWTGGETLVRTEFTAAEGATTLVTTTVLYSSREARDGALRTGMTEGMEQGFRNLDELLASSAPA